MNGEVNPWVEGVGPCYTAISMRGVLGVTADELDKARRDLRLLALETEGGVVLYPMWQIREGEVINGLREVLDILRSAIDDPWAWVRWLVFTPPPDNQNRSPIDDLRGGRKAEVIRHAECVSRAWARNHGPKREETDE